MEGETVPPEDMVSGTKVAYTDDNIVGGNIYYYPETGAIVDCEDSVVSCVIPSEIDGVSITMIDNNVFYNTRVKYVTIPDSVTIIASGAFASCDLREIIVPASVTFIGGGAFQACNNLRKAEILGKATLGVGVFSGDQSLEEVDISNVIALGDQTFQNCSALYKVKYPQNLNVIPSNTFLNCQSLKEFTISKNVKRIGYGAFSYANLSGDFEVPANVEEIGRYAFSNNSIVNLTINANIKTIPWEAFYMNPLSTVRICEGIIGIEESAFVIGGSYQIKSIYLPSTLEYIDEGAFGSTYEGWKKPIKNVYFAGCESKWEKVIIGDMNNRLTIDSTMYFAYHNYVYTYDDNAHWMACKYCGTMIGEKSSHSLDETGSCPICGYGSPEPHQHSYIWFTDESMHFEFCTECSEVAVWGPHDIVDGKCSVCGYTPETDEPIEPEKPECDHDFEIKYDRDNHWKICSVCGLVVAPEPHSEPDSSGNCTECGFELKLRYDVNKDGKVSSLDAVIILRALAGLD